METPQLTRATDIAPLKSDGAKILWQSFSVENLPILELVADLIEGTHSNQDGKIRFDGVPLKPPSVLKNASVSRLVVFHVSHSPIAA